uniref:C2 domain-containing protein n=1 Tax=Ascaris lumbricoides TaxID=6252 RepID=A0A0M3HF62_ASCLU
MNSGYRTARHCLTAVLNEDGRLKSATLDSELTNLKKKHQGSFLTYMSPLIPSLNCIVAMTATSVNKKSKKILIEPILNVQIWDRNKFMKKDGYVGQLSVNLLQFPEAEMDTKGSPMTGSPPSERPCACVRAAAFCIDTHCCTRKRPAQATPLRRAPKLDFDARKKKDDDCDPKLQYLTGNVELQINLLTHEEASSEPVGRKRRKPNHVCYFPLPYDSTSVTPLGKRFI